MINENKNTVIEEFVHEMSAAYHLDNSSFSDLYSWHYFDKTSALKKEIIDNLNSLSPDRFNAYIKYVKDEIHEVYGYYDPDECKIGKWIEKFNLIEKDFPFYSNEEVTRLLGIREKDYPSELEKRRNIRLMQLEFHWYAGHLEYLKMKRFIDELLPEEKDSSTISGTNISKSIVKLQSMTWFKVGLFFAKGEVQKLYDEYKSDKGYFKKITLELGFKETDRPYFSETINNSTNHPKNIYRNFDKMKKIHDHCVNNRILMCEDFINIFKALQEK
ncbi:hypothetical protein [Aestuariivivens sediminicola]|uniref:hypothetical protein n=1 Tax=Aestuariivivens sediminicola TaxID=2913560 RepID=UPI001F57767E|nr:hypothetical protein [Aestuariivivens sediminicola]